MGPTIDVLTRWTISNGESSTPLQDGRWTTAEVGSEWKIHELAFYSDSGCTNPVRGSSMASGQTGQYHSPDEAFDGSTDTAWHAQCAPCAALEAWIGILVQDVVRCVRWVQAPVLTGSGSRSVVFQIGGQELARASGLEGGHWEGLQYAAAAG